MFQNKSPRIQFAGFCFGVGGNNLLAASGFLLQFVNALGSVGFAERIVERLVRLIGQRLQIRFLRAGHRLFSSRPGIGVFHRVRVFVGVDFVVSFGGRILILCGHNSGFIPVNETKQSQCQKFDFLEE